MLIGWSRATSSCRQYWSSLESVSQEIQSYVSFLLARCRLDNVGGLAVQTVVSCKEGSSLRPAALNCFH